MQFSALFSKESSFIVVTGLLEAAGSGYIIFCKLNKHNSNQAA